MLRHRSPGFFSLSVLSLALTGCGGSAPPDPRTAPPPVRVALVDEGAGQTRTFTGTVQARIQSDLGFRVSGKVLERLVDAGQQVKRGQPLLRMDPADLDLAASAQRQAVAAAEARATQAAQEEVRYRRLAASQVVSRSAYDQIKAAADTAQAELRAARAQAAVAGNASSYAVLLADADGVVSQTLAEPGQVVAAGQVVVQLARSGPREAVVQLPETLRPALGSTATASIFGRVGEPITAHLRVLSSAADPVSRTFEARYVLDTADEPAPLGATVALELPTQGKAAAEGGVRVPLAGINDSGKGAGVWLIHGQPAMATWRPVKVLRLADDSAYVIGNLKHGDRVAALGAHLLREGQRVRILDTRGAASAGAPSP
ncbi:efflux RND transporter periplasmic adaptor subunit [Stenotrophomonas sp. ISL-67]|uniref:efflux RND transporter periplasmic adaptor subunit n=1 Tax=Stenotrophomonas sp. ISL-67 TaxID=2819171 RepID=UPI001BE763C6|nr:efflux RND transporter periplasmic adaptor subunit [Stenotrophomonas sp. ISL-67]MBT2766256.1 efflux RND transporter periplasmic adaptor subunit [Stenotrophomonas sp. ISL-67]